MIRNIHGIKTYYEVIGDGKPLLVLHGWGNSSDTVRPIAMLAKGCGYRVFSIDLPGFGFSAAPPKDWHVRDYMEFVINFLDEFDLATVDIIAHSFGGRITIMLSALYPGRVGKIALVDSAGIKPRRDWRYYLSVYSYKALKAILRSIYGEARLERFLSQRGSADFRNAGGLRGTFVKVINEDLTQYLSRIQAPTLLVWGEKDMETPLSDGYKMKELIPNSSLAVIENAGHHCFIDHPDEFNSIITASFLGNSEGAPC
ncbi:MAG: alpha/beta hydrolase [Anaerolineales bacterium]|nr:alpha/beta hydrolase [Anaerolineales bacterium]